MGKSVKKMTFHKCGLLTLNFFIYIYLWEFMSVVIFVLRIDSVCPDTLCGLLFNNCRIQGRIYCLSTVDIFEL